ncbi:MAG: alpha/beta fold hydrolase [Chloroflexi bacterium]|nr:alpha/beta fold hydrolase [Chloroflexota bacterium]
MSTVNLSLYHVRRPPEIAPAVGAKAPLLLMLHGVRSNEDDLFSLIPYIDERFCVISIRAPLTLGPGQYGWYQVAFQPDRIERNAHELELARQRLVAFIKEAVSTYDLDPHRVYLMGFSQGAIMSLAVMLTAPQMLAGVAAMSGSLPDEVLPIAAAQEQLKDFPVIVVHGFHDDIIPIAEARRLRDYLTDLPVELDYREYPMRHQISDQSLDDVCGWLIAQLNRDKAG